MSTTAPILKTARGSQGAADILAIGFGTTAAMWSVGYVCRFPPGIVPSGLLLILMLACMSGGGLVAGRYTNRGWRGGLYAGLLSALLNLLILGSLLTADEPNRIVPSALWWLPGSFLVAAGLGSASGAIGALRPHDNRDRNWTWAFVTVAVAASLLLLIAGGLVTSNDAGLAVVDWPNSFGYNMFLYPLSRMTGGIYYEHAHRLMGSLVGLTVVALTIHLWRVYSSRPLRWLAVTALLAVIVQGILGGLRVTGRLTLSATPQQTSPSITLAVAHGVFGQIFFGMLISIWVLTSTAWQNILSTRTTRSRPTDRSLSAALVLVLVIQLVLGAIQRHLARGLLVHITLGVLASSFCVLCGARAWGIYTNRTIVKRLGLTLLLLTGLQVLLGIGALIVTGLRGETGCASVIEVLTATAHQAIGAILLACAVALSLWLRR